MQEARLSIHELLRDYPGSPRDLVGWSVPLVLPALPLHRREMTNASSDYGRLDVLPSDVFSPMSSDSLEFKLAEVRLKPLSLMLEGRSDAYAAMDVCVSLRRLSREMSRDKMEYMLPEASTHDPFSKVWAESWDSFVVFEGFHEDKLSCCVVSFLEPEYFDRVVLSESDFTLEASFRFSARVSVDEIAASHSTVRTLPTIARLGDWEDTFSAYPYVDACELPKEALGDLDLYVPAIRGRLRLQCGA